MDVHAIKFNLFHQTSSYCEKKGCSSSWQFFALGYICNNVCLLLLDSKVLYLIWIGNPSPTKSSIRSLEEIMHQQQQQQKKIMSSHNDLKWHFVYLFPLNSTYLTIIVCECLKFFLNIEEKIGILAPHYYRIFTIQSIYTNEWKTLSGF